MAMLNEALLREALKGRRFGNPLWCENEVESTFVALRERIREGAPEGAVLVAEAQTKGRGRLGRDWVSPKGAGLYFNLLLRPKAAASKAFGFNFAAALGVARALRCLGFEALLKWPNDVLIGGKKVCGILCEAGFDEGGGLDFVSVGIGVNVKSRAVPEALREKAAALQEFSSIERETLLLALLDALEESVALCLGDFGAMMEQYKALCLTLGRFVAATGGQEAKGLALGIAEGGELIVEEEGGGLVYLRAADVSIRGIMGYV